MKNKMFILLLILSVLLISLFSSNVFSEDTDPRIGLYYRLSPKDDTVSIDVFIQSASNVAGCQVWLTYNPTVLDYVDEVFKEGDYFPANAFYGQRQLESLSDTETRLRFAVASAPIENKKSGIIATLTFKTLNVEGNLSLSLVDGDLNNGTGTLFSDAAGSLSLPGVVEPDDHSNIPAWGTPIDIKLGQALSSLHPQSGKIDYESDLDYFKIQVPSPGELTVYSEKSTIDLVGLLLDSKGSYLRGSSVNETVGINDSKARNFRIVHRVTDATLSTPKTYYVEVTASDNDSIGDYRLNVKFTARESPELIIESIKAVPLTALPGEEVELSTVLPGEKFKLVVIYKNVGDPTSAETAVKYYQSTNATLSETDLLIGTGKNVSLDGKSSIRRTRTITAPQNSGVYYYGACVGTVPNESDPNNNCSDVISVTVNKGTPGLEIPEGLISDVAFTPHYTFFVLNPQFLEVIDTDNLLKDHWCYKSTITLEIGGLHRDSGGKSDYYMLPLPPKDYKSLTEQAEDVGVSAGETLFQHFVGKLAFGKVEVGKAVSNITKVGKILLDFADISDPYADPSSELLYYDGQGFGDTYGGDTFPILFVIQNERLSSVGLKAEQVYYPPGAWIELDLDLTKKPEEVTALDLFNWLPDLIEVPLDFVGGIGVGIAVSAKNLLFGTIDEFINGVHGLLVEKRNEGYELITARYEEQWNLEETWQQENSALAAPSANIMSLSDYPPFQRYPSEFQEYLLRRFGGPVNVSTEQLQMPKKTSLLANYPNPFNPETWIPYQLAEPADVTLTIYNIQGHVVRDLDLGHQRAGRYHTRNRAAYWDGRNAQGESVASGVYFYTLTAGDFTATRKLLIRK